MASDVFFTTNPAEFTKLEGLYISERNPPGFIRGADLSAVGIGGITVRGPSEVQQITSTARFFEIFGGRDYGSGGDLVNEVWRALVNKPFGTLYVQRVIPTGSDVASFNAEDGTDGTGDEIVTVSASSAGLWGNNVSYKVEDASDGVGTHWNLRVKYLGEEVLYENLETSNGTSDQADVDEIMGDDAARFVDVTVLLAGRPGNSALFTGDYATAADSDDFMALGTTIAAYTSVPGTNGTAVDTDYSGVFTNLATYEGPSIVMMAGALDWNNLNSFIVTQAPLVADRVFLTWSGTHGQAASVEAANVTTDITTRSDRIIWCHNGPYTLDPETGLEIQTPPHEWMASVLSQNDVDIHPGSQQTAAQLAGIKRLTVESLSRADLIALRNGGVCTVEKLPENFLFRSAVTTDLTTGKTEITRRRSADFLQLSAASRLRYFVKRKNTLEVRAQMAGELVGFSQSLMDQSRIVEDFEIDQESVNTDSQRAQGVEKILWRVRLIGHILHLVLETEIGTGVVIEA